MGLFSTGGGGGGDRYEYVNDGIYVGELESFSEGPTFTDESGNPQPKVRWNWKLYQPDGTTAVMHEGSQVLLSELTSDRTGERSTAAKWFSAHLKRDFNNRNDNVDTVMQECVGKKVNLIVSTKATGYKKVDCFKGSI